MTSQLADPHSCYKAKVPFHSLSRSSFIHQCYSGLPYKSWGIASDHWRAGFFVSHVCYIPKSKLKYKPGFGPNLVEHDDSGSAPFPVTGKVWVKSLHTVAERRNPFLVYLTAEQPRDGEQEQHHLFWGRGPRCREADCKVQGEGCDIAGGKPKAQHQAAWAVSSSFTTMVHCFP